MEIPHFTNFISSYSTLYSDGKLQITEKSEGGKRGDRAVEEGGKRGDRAVEEGGKRGDRAVEVER